MPKPSFTNQQIYADLASRIEESPALLPAQRQRDDAFVDLFVGREDHEIRAIVEAEPQVANIFYSVLYDRVIREAAMDGLNAVNPYEVFQGPSDPNKWGYVATDVIDSDAFDGTASPIPTNPPRVASFFSDARVDRTFTVTVSDEQLRSAFNSPTGVSSLVSLILKRVRDSAQLYVRDYVETKLGIAAPVTVVQAIMPVVEIASTDYNLPLTASPTLADFDSDGRETALRFRAWLKQLRAKMVRASDDFNLGDTDGPFTSNLPEGRGILLVDSNTIAGMAVTADQLYNDGTNIGALFERVIEVPGLAATQETSAGVGKYNTIAMIVDPQFFEYRLALDTTREWKNEKGLYTNYFHHLWLHSLTAPVVSAVAIQIKTAL